MNPRISRAGRSTKWLNYYLSHDKQSDTSNRLGEVWYLNMPVDETGNGPADSERAAKIMGFVAKNWRELQEAYFPIEQANVTDPAKHKDKYRPPSRPPEKSAYTFSLRFHPDDKDKITPDLMRQAAQGAIAQLEMQDLYALAYEHTDYNHALIPDAIEKTDPKEYDYVSPEMLRAAAKQNADKLGLAKSALALPDEQLRQVVVQSMRRPADNAASTISTEPRIAHIDVNIIPGDGIPPTEFYPQHPSHIHLSVCKINPLTGRTHPTYEDALKLSRFCQAFAAEHGLKKVNQRVVNNARRDKGEYVEHQQVPRSDYERFKSYRGKSRQAVERQRTAQQEADKKQLAARQAIQRVQFKQRVLEDYGPTRRRILDDIAASRRTVTLDHMSTVFRVLTRIKQRFTGELKRELQRIGGLRKSLRSIGEAVQKDRQAFEAEQAREVQALARIHGQQRQRDADYFEELRRRRRTETAGEAGSKSFAHASRPDKTQEPQPHLKAEILEQQRQARIDTRDDAATRIAKSFGLKEPPTERPADAPTSAAEAVEQAMEEKKKLYSRARIKEHGRGVDRDKNRKRKPRNRKPTRD